MVEHGADAMNLLHDCSETGHLGCHSHSISASEHMTR